MFEGIIGNYNYLDFFKETIASFGGVDNRRNEPLKYVFRNNTIANPFPTRGAFFGCINETEESTGAYSDLSIVIFPSNEPTTNDDRWIIALGVGTLGFKNDYNIVSIPGTRRKFANCLSSDSFIKDDFMDVEKEEGIKRFCQTNNIPNTLMNAIKDYRRFLLACSLVNPNDQNETKTTIKKFLAIYADIREWPSINQRIAVNNIIQNRNDVNEREEIEKLLFSRKYIVLQGAPGTGKTRMAKSLVSNFDTSNVFFTQFHAETAYSDFIYGIIPDVSVGNLRYTSKEGVFVQAIKRAQETNDKVFLIIDEINRANLSNVLGPCFYLFEPTMSGSGIKLKICPELELEKLPGNLYIIATMNTADRSLAVVDFALRRRFAWYTMYPHTIVADEGKSFCTDEFINIEKIFDDYASDEELNLQPGQAYFIVSESNKDTEIKSRLKYEVMPLIKEYLANGMLNRAKDDFVNYFRTRINEEMYK